MDDEAINREAAEWKDACVQMTQVAYEINKINLQSLAEIVELRKENRQLKERISSMNGATKSAGIVHFGSWLT